MDESLNLIKQHKKVEEDYFANQKRALSRLARKRKCW